MTVADQSMHHIQSKLMFITNCCQYDAWYRFASIMSCVGIITILLDWAFCVLGRTALKALKDKSVWEGSSIKHKSRQSKEILVGCLLCSNKTTCRFDSDDSHQT